MSNESFMAWWKPIWDVYVASPDPWVGIFNLAGAILTAAALIFTAIAAIAAFKSTKVAQNALENTMRNSRRDEFTRHFTLLLEQHNTQHEIVKNYLDSEEGKLFFCKVREPLSLKQAHQLMHGHTILSPYMRVLYHLLKYIGKSFYKSNPAIEEMKGFSSLVRSLIRNDVLYIVALNSSFTKDEGVENQYAKYQKLLHKFSFFEHAEFYRTTELQNYRTTENENESAEKSLLAIQQNNSEATSLTTLELIDKASYGDFKIELPLPLIVASLYENPSYSISSKYLFSFHEEIFLQYYKNKNKRLSKMKRDLKVELFFKEYIGRYAVLTNNDTKVEIIDNNLLPKDEMESHPLVDIKYITQALKNYEKPDYKSDKNLLFCKLNERNLPLYLTSAEFDEECRDYLERLEDIKKIEQDYLLPEIKAHTEFWKSYEAEIASKRVSALPSPECHQTNP